MDNVNHKNLKNINISIPNNLEFINKDVETILKKNEETIEKYLERIIYSSSLTENTKEHLNTIFNKIRNDILNNIT